MWAIITMYLCLIPCLALFIHAKHTNKEIVSIVLKAASTGIILITGAYGMWSTQGSFGVYHMLIVVGLAFGLAGDIGICKTFVLGMFFFALGHLAYIAGILSVTTHALWAIPIAAALCALIFMLYKKIKNLNLGNLVIPVIIYGLIIVTMVSLAATTAFSVIPGGIVLFIGAVLFTISDALLALNKFSDDFNQGIVKVDRFNYRADSGTGLNKKLDTVSLCCYYIGQSLFSVSIFCIS